MVSSIKNLIISDSKLGNSFTSNQVDIKTKYSSEIEYTSHSPIIINYESDFQTNGIPGDGSPSTPYLIENYNITTDINFPITINNIQAHILIQNNYFNGLSSSVRGINLINVSNCIIQSNIIEHCFKGIYLGTKCSNILISQDIISETNDGAIQVDEESFNNTIEKNQIYYSANAGIKITDRCYDNLVSENSVYNTQSGGAIFMHSSEATISDNYFFQGDRGIYFVENNNSIISNNIITGSIVGIQLFNSSHNLLQNNTIIDSLSSGFQLEGDSNNFTENVIMYGEGNSGILLAGGSYNYILNNVVFNCTWIGLDIWSATNNIIKWNDFIWNGLKSDSQAQIQEDYYINTISNNYWDDWTYPDTNSDGIVDRSYLIPEGALGTSNTTDDAPSISPINSFSGSLHFINRPRFINIPTIYRVSNQYYFTGTFRLEWCPSIDSLGHSVTYSLFYKEEIEWVQIAKDITENFYKWDTRGVVSSGGLCCLELKIIATCSEDLSVEYVCSSYGVTNEGVNWPFTITIFTFFVLIIFRKRKNP